MTSKRSLVVFFEVLSATGHDDGNELFLAIALKLNKQCRFRLVFRFDDQIRSCLDRLEFDRPCRCRPGIG